MSSPALATAELTVSLKNLVANWKSLQQRFQGADCAGVVKADAYGLGITRVLPALRAAGCKTFYVAHLEEALAVLPLLNGAGIRVLNGVIPGEEAVFAEAGITPVINSLAQLTAWRTEAKRRETRLPALIHLDTGMRRLGFSTRETDILTDRQNELLSGITLAGWMTHPACADDPADPMTGQQFGLFEKRTSALPSAPRGFCNSAALFGPRKWHFDMARPGIALYGGNPQPFGPNPMRPVVELKARILQTRAIDAHESVGYGGAWCAERPSRIATIAMGYADGYFRCLGNKAAAVINGKTVPVVGRVSMDMVTLDVTGLSEQDCHAGQMVTVLGGEISAQTLAELGGTIDYEVLTSLGRRYRRVYRDDEDDRDTDAKGS